MGPKEKDPMAVVNSKLEVHGTSGLRVIDGSIMPTHVTGNPNAPTIMIGERGADFIIKKWKNSKTGFKKTSSLKEEL